MEEEARAKHEENVQLSLQIQNAMERLHSLEPDRRSSRAGEEVEGLRSDLAAETKRRKAAEDKLKHLMHASPAPPSGPVSSFASLVRLLYLLLGWIGLLGFAVVLAIGGALAPQSVDSMRLAH